MAEHCTHILHVLLYEFESGHPAAEPHRKLSQVFGTEAPSESVRAWFQHFKAGNKKLEDKPRSGRSTAISFDELKNMAEQHPYESVRLVRSSWNLPFRTAAGQHDSYCRGVLLSTAKAGKIRKEHPKLATFACCTIKRALTVAQSDYHLFRTLQHHLEEKRYDDRDHLENYLRAFFASQVAGVLRQRNP